MTNPETESYGYVPTDFSKLKVGTKQITDAVFKLGDLGRLNPSLASKDAVFRAIHYG